MRPLIAIFGTTGVGKSKLGIDLALRLTENQPHGWQGARIINADSMQVYAGMDILTNKVSVVERQGIEHLLLGFKTPGEQYIVGQWVQDAIAAIEETHARNQIPIVVGGTAYWLQHLIFPNRLLSSGPTPSQRTPLSEEIAKSLTALPQNLRELYNALPDKPPSPSMDPERAFALHSLLTSLDAPVAARWHWRDTRKVLRNLHIIKDTGRRPSDIFYDQSQIDVIPRYRTLCFWLYANPCVLDSRLDERVDEMIERGVVSEIRHLREVATPSSTDPTVETASVVPPSDVERTDYTRGIYQSIGYKEFNKYLASPTPSNDSYHHAVEQMKQSTRQYARRQILWIRNKLLPAVRAVNSKKLLVPTYLLDVTALGDNWETSVRSVAETITEGFLGDDNLPDPLTLSEVARNLLTIDEKPTDPTSTLATRRKLICPVCTVDEDRPVMVEETREWEVHKRTRRHRRLSRKKNNENTAYNEPDQPPKDEEGLSLGKLSSPSIIF